MSERPRPPGCWSLVGNTLWLVLAGWWLALGYVMAGVINCIFIITIPFGVQAFKLAGFTLWPFGRVVIDRPERDAGVSCFGNVLWFILSGLWLAIAHVLAGILLCLTIIGIPFGLACIRMAGLALAPFGRSVVRRDRVPSGVTIVVRPPATGPE